MYSYKALQQMFTATFFTIAPNWNQLKCPSMDEWINKMWYIHTMKYYSTIKGIKCWYMLQYRWTSKILCQVKKANTHKKLRILRLLLSVQQSRLCTCTAGSTASIPGWGTKIPHATWCVQCGSENPLPTDAKEISGLTEMFLNWIEQIVVQQSKVLKLV